MTYRSVLYLKLKLKTFYFDLIFTDFWLQSILYEIESNEVVSFFSIQTLIRATLNHDYIEGEQKKVDKRFTSYHKND